MWQHKLRLIFALAWILVVAKGAQADSSSPSGSSPQAGAWQSAGEKSKVDQKITEIDKVIAKGPFKDDWDSLKSYKVPEWYQDAKFGIFIHWGLYSVPAFANEWYSRNMYEKDSNEFKHHVATYGPHTKFGYKDFIPQFKAEKFDPAHWAELFKAAGAQYVIPVAEHHDGFAMYDSDLSRWTAKKMGPKRDLIGDLSKEVRKQGLVAGTSSHRAEHWWFMSGGTKFDSDVQDPKYADFYGPAVGDDSSPDEEYLRNWLARSCELVDKYKPQVLYFDWWIGERPVFTPYVKKFAAYYYNRAAEWGTGVVLNTKDKAYVPGTSVMDMEKGKLTGIHPEAWQTDTSISWRSWAYLKDDQLKDTGLILRTLIDAVSKNGNLLLDIGPRPDGTIPEGQEKVLREVGEWLKLNGEAIYGTRPWVAFGEGPTQEKGGKFSESDVKYQEGDVRFTRKGDILYVITMIEPTKPLKIKSLSASKSLGVNGNITLLGSDAKVKTRSDKTGLTLSPPEKTGTGPVVYRIPLKGFGASALRVATQGSKLTASVEIQNYNEKELTKEITFAVNGKKTASKEVTVDPGSAFNMSFQYEAPKAGYYRASLSWPGQAPLKGAAALPSLDLIGEWLFKKGDKAGWSKPVVNEKDWEKVTLPAAWEEHSGYKEDNVYGWYRKKVVIPAAWKGHDLILPLGKIDDTDAAYFNGVKIGQTGKFPPKFEGFWNVPRSYKVPARIVKWGKENTIAVRVFDAYGGGGIYDGPLGPIEVK